MRKKIVFLPTYKRVLRVSVGLYIYSLGQKYPDTCFFKVPEKKREIQRNEIQGNTHLSTTIPKWYNTWGFGTIVSMLP
jgi:hypothetical protein